MLPPADAAAVEPRVLVLTSALDGGGAEAQVRALIAHATPLGARFAVAALRVGNAEASLPDTRLYALNRWRGRLTSVLPTARQIVECVRDWRADVVLVTLYHMYQLLQVARDFAGLRAPVVLRESSNLRLALRTTLHVPLLTPILLRRLYRTADAIVAQTRREQEELVRAYRLTPQRVTVIPNLFDLSAIQQSSLQTPALGPEALDGTPLLVSSGTLYDVKNYPAILEAFQIVLHAAPRACMVILGDGPDREALVQKASSLGVASAVTFAGRLQNPHAVVGRATALLHASRFEGFPNVLAEAMALAVPCVVQRGEYGLDEIVEHGRSGFICDTPAECAERVLELARDRGLRDRIGEAARRKAADFVARAGAARYCGIFARLACQARAGSRSGC
jgi:glycosyltransferase involved in cell wall biosynthesis